MKSSQLRRNDYLKGVTGSVPEKVRAPSRSHIRPISRGVVGRVRVVRQSFWVRRGLCTPSVGERAVKRTRLILGGVGRRQLGAGFRPDSANVLAGADEKARRGDRHKCHEQGIFDQILTRFIREE